MSLSRFAVLVLALGPLSSGCHSGPKKVRVNGTVTLEGKPLPQGEAYFVTPGGGTPPEILPVTDGQFAGEVTVGKKRVEFYAQKPMGKPTGMGMGEELVLNLIHDDYSVNSKLTAEVSDAGLNPSAFEVKANRDAK